MRQASFRLFRLSVCVVVLTMIFAIVTSAQFRAAFQGIVTDNAGAVVPGASVTLVNKETGRSQKVLSGDNGFFRFSGLAPGKYSLIVDKEGFAKKELNSVDVAAEVTQGFDIALDLAGVTASVEVTGSQETTLQTENPNIQNTVGTREVRALPQTGRNPYELLALTPGIIGSFGRNGNGQAANFPNSTGPGGTNASIFQTENQVPISAAGQRVDANNFQVDGVSVNSLQYGGAAVLTPNQESVKEVVVSSSSFSAEDGRNSGAQVRVVSQNGTNEFHGSAFFRYNDPKLNAFNRYFGNSVRPSTPSIVMNRDRQFGGSFGGPLPFLRFGEGGPVTTSGKDKLFFFVSYEGLRNNTNNTYQTFIETEQYRQQVIAARPNGVTAQVFQMPGIAPRVASIVPRTCASVFGGDAANRCRDVPGGLDLGSITGTRGNYLLLGGGVGKADIGGGFDGVPDIVFANLFNPNTQRGNQYNARIDSNVNDANKVAVSTYVTKRDDLSSDVGSRSRPSSDIANQPLNYIVTGIVVSNLSATSLNEARVNFTRFASDQVKASSATNFGIPNIEVEGVPFDRIRFGAGRSETTPAVFSQNTFEISDTVTKIFGNHAVKIGGLFQREFNNNNLSGGARPKYSFVGLFNLANDTPIFEEINADPTTGLPANAQRFFRTATYGAFVQDDWKVRPNLTLNLGLRYEYFSPLTETEGRLTDLQLGSGAQTLSNARLVQVDSLYKKDLNNFAPRIGFAYSPDFRNSSGYLKGLSNKIVLRGGFGIFYNRLQTVLFSNSQGNPPFFARYSICCGTNAADFGSPFAGGQILYAVGSGRSADSFPRNPVLGSGINPATGLPNDPTLEVEIYGSYNDQPNPMVYKYSLDLQYELPYQMVASIGYEGNTSKHLPRLVDLNQFFTPLPGTSAVRYVSPDIEASYNGMNLRLERRFAQGFQVSANYRYSKGIDTLSNAGPGAVTNQTFPIDLSEEKGPSDYDSRHNFVLSGIAELPFFRNKSTLAGKLLGGFELGGILTHYTGFPWTPKVGQFVRTSTGAGIFPIRPIAYFGGVQQDTSNGTFLTPNGYFPGGGSRYFNLGINPNPNGGDPRLQDNPPGIGRNTFRGPNYFSVDMNITKRFGLPGLSFLGENRSLELRADIFNLFNHLNLQQFGFFSPGTFVNNANFGEPDGALAGRTVALQLRFRF